MVLETDVWFDSDEDSESEEFDPCIFDDRESYISQDDIREMSNIYPSAGEWTDIAPQSLVKITFDKAKEQAWVEAKEEMNFIKNKVMQKIGDEKTGTELLIGITMLFFGPHSPMFIKNSRCNGFVILFILFVDVY